MRTLGFIVSCWVAAGLLLAASAPPGSAQDAAPSRQTIALKQALALKVVADEEFLTGAREEAQRSYGAARDAVRGLAADSTVTRDQKDLLELEIDYRLALLARGLPFFFSTSRHDTANPIAIRKSFDRNLNAVLQIKTELLALERTLHTDKRTITAARASDLMADERFKVSQIGEVKADAIQDAHRDRKAHLEDRIGQVKSRREALVALAKQHLKAVDAVQDQTSAVAISSISSALGLPVDLQQVAKGKIDEKAILNLASTFVGANGVRLGDSLGALGKGADDVVMPTGPRSS